MASRIIRYPEMKKLTRRMKLNHIVLAITENLQTFYGLMKLVTYKINEFV